MEHLHIPNQQRRHCIVSIGIDVAKGKSMVCAMKPYGEVVIPPKEISRLESDVKSFIVSIQAITEEVRIIMESTGAYHLPLLQSFQQAGLFVCVVPPSSCESMLLSHCARLKRTR